MRPISVGEASEVVMIVFEGMGHTVVRLWMGANVTRVSVMNIVVNRILKRG